ncbi:MAG: hypothetical protein Roseis2KO_17430 [Roseivirga sp.]
MNDFRKNQLTILTVISMAFALTVNGQDEQDTPYTSYFTGDRADIRVQPRFGITMMGGRKEHNQAMQWFLERANGGDVLVLRASGSDGYNDYLFNELGVVVNSVETLVVDNEEAAKAPYVIQQIKNAEAIWMAGGNQFKYISIWGNSEMKKALNDHINVKKGAIGGTSAGMAVLGEFSFSAEKGSITAEQALADLYHERLRLENDFLHIPLLSNLITDTHFSARNRQGRLTAFMARLLIQTQGTVYGIACDERTAVCIGADGIARVFGHSPDRPGSVFFLQTYCDTPLLPEAHEAGQPFTWYQQKQALVVYKVQGDSSGSKTFDLNDWLTTSGEGNWQRWYVEEGAFHIIPSKVPDCDKP